MRNIPHMETSVGSFSDLFQPYTYESLANKPVWPDRELVDVKENWLYNSWTSKFWTLGSQYFHLSGMVLHIPFYFIALAWLVFELYCLPKFRSLLSMVHYRRVWESIRGISVHRSLITNFVSLEIIGVKMNFRCTPRVGIFSALPSRCFSPSRKSSPPPQSLIFPFSLVKSRCKSPIQVPSESPMRSLSCLGDSKNSQFFLWDSLDSG